MLDILTSTMCDHRHDLTTLQPLCEFSKPLRYTSLERGLQMRSKPLQPSVHLWRFQTDLKWQAWRLLAILLNLWYICPTQCKPFLLNFWTWALGQEASTVSEAGLEPSTLQTSYKTSRPLSLHCLASTNQSFELRLWEYSPLNMRTKSGRTMRSRLFRWLKRVTEDWNSVMRFIVTVMTTYDVWPSRDISDIFLYCC